MSTTNTGRLYKWLFSIVKLSILQQAHKMLCSESNDKWPEQLTHVVYYYTTYNVKTGV